MSIVTVSTTAELQASLGSAQGGDTILLQAGTYSGLSLMGENFGTGVTISSADPTHQAVLTNFNMQDVQGLTVSHLDMKVLLPNYTGFNIYSSQHVTFDQVHVYGPAGAPDPDVHAVNFFESSYITFSNSEIEQVAQGLGIARSDHIVVSGNNIHNVNSDTLDFVQVSNAVISGNVLHDFFPTEGNHPDAMQFGTSNSTVASHDVTISDNLIYAGAGQNSQGIFISDEVGTLPFQNFTIADNTIVGTGSSAIRATHNSGLVISGNDVFTLAGGPTTNMLVQYSDHVTLSGNTASSISATAANGNTVVSETNDVGNAAALSDGGAAVIQQWMATHVVGPQGQAPVSPAPLAPISPPPPPAPVSPEPAPTPGENLVATAGNSHINAGAGDDTLTSAVSDDYLHGGAGNDIVSGGVGFDDINGMIGNDTAHGAAGDDWVVGGKGDDLLFGDAGGDLVWGNIGNDTLDGGDGADQVLGGQGDDVLNGGAGGDFLSGDLGQNTVTGGAGADIFHANAGGGSDRVLDFHAAEGDRVQVDSGTSYVVQQVGADTVIDLGNGGQMILVGVQMSTLAHGWIFGV